MENQRKIVLVVDNEESVHKLIRAHLEEYAKGKYLLLKAENPPDAKRIFKESKPYIVIMDIDLRDPTCNGIQLSQQFLDIDDEFVLIMMTTSASSQVEDSFIIPHGYFPYKTVFEGLEDQISWAIKRYQQERSLGDKIILKTYAGDRTFWAHKIVYLWAQGDGFLLKVKERNLKLVPTTNLKEFLNEHKGKLENFVRVHRSWIINQEHFLNPTIIKKQLHLVMDAPLLNLDSKAEDGGEFMLIPVGDSKRREVESELSITR